jgi:molecular chaperone DnaK
MQAGLLAGLDVIGIVNEPVAAALYYATTCSVSGKVLVYDLGGGTFDVTIMDVKDSKMNIICSQGDHALGGVDFDKAVVEMLEKKYKASKKAELITSDEEKAKYEDEAEDIKKTLSRRKTAKKMIYGSAGSFRLEITRKMFEKAISPSIERTSMLLELALKEASLKPDDIDKVLLVGGSSRVPLVKQQLEKMFGVAPEITVNVDECVALGAAIHAGLTMLRQRPDEVSTGIASGLQDIELTDVCNHSYGTLCAPIDELTGKRVVENRIILKKNTPLPCEQSQTFYTTKQGQKQLQVAITQGEDIDPEYVNNIAIGKLELPGDRPKNCPIEVTYSYDLNQRMHCMFEDTQSGKSIEVDLEQVDKGLDCEKVRKQTEEMAQIQIE